MIESSPTHQDQSDNHQDHVDSPVVSSHTISRKDRLHSTMKFNHPKIPPNQFKPAKGGDLLQGKFEPEKTLAR